jgi:hypothetical protein
MSNGMSSAEFHSVQMLQPVIGIARSFSTSHGSVGQWSPT